MTSTYRQRWKAQDLGTPASALYHSNAGFVMAHKDGPTITGKIDLAAWRVGWVSTDEQRIAALGELKSAIADALNAGYMIDVTTNRDSLRPNSYKHCITLHVRKPGERETLPPERVFINRMGRAEHDAILPHIRAMFIGGEAKA